MRIAKFDDGLRLVDASENLPSPRMQNELAPQTMLCRSINEVAFGKRSSSNGAKSRTRAHTLKKSPLIGLFQIGNGGNGGNGGNCLKTIQNIPAKLINYNNSANVGAGGTKSSAGGGATGRGSIHYGSDGSDGSLGNVI